MLILLRPSTLLTNQCAIRSITALTYSVWIVPYINHRNSLFQSKASTAQWLSVSEIARNSKWDRVRKPSIRKKSLVDRRRVGTLVHSHSKNLVDAIMDKKLIPDQSFLQKIADDNDHRDPLLLEHLLGHMTGVWKFFRENVKWDPMMRTEQFVRHSELRFRGRFDVLLNIRGHRLVLIDIKTVGGGAEVDNKFFVQLAAYLEAFRVDPRFSVYPKIDKMGVLRTFPDGRAAELRMLTETEMQINMRQEKRKRLERRKAKREQKRTEREEREAMGLKPGPDQAEGTREERRQQHNEAKRLRDKARNHGGLDKYEANHCWM
uniref:PDDEXK_1 domain-containing protein n=1 Tax=Steinernema glaseri TaxID=37863 RepID=A0A1I7ZNH5_9BILA